jgi:shikimate kinase
MRIFLTGVGCVGKTMIGKKMGELLGVRFFDLDYEIESFFETRIERLKDRFLTIHSFRNVLELNLGLGPRLHESESL